jgi:drug/metabolite transporter (DMT)-like permease
MNDDVRKLMKTMAKNSAVGGLAVVLMVLGGYLVQWLQTNAGYAKPIAITYVNTASLTLLFVGQLAFSAAKNHLNRAHRVHGASDSCWQRFIVSPLVHFDSEVRARSGGHSIRRLAIVSIPFAFLWMLANVLFIFGLPMTNVPSSMSLEQAATVFVYALSVCLLGESLTFPKVVSVFACIGGVVIIAFADQAAGNDDNSLGSADPLLGDLLVLASTVATALYLVFFKRFFCAPLSLGVLNVFLGCIGATTLALFWPVLVIVDVTGFETLELPSGSALPLFMANIAETLAFNYVLNAGVIYVTPLFMRVSLICTIPLSFAINLILHGAGAFNWVQLVGALFVIAGFVAFSLISAYTSVAAAPIIEIGLGDDQEVALIDNQEVDNDAEQRQEEEERHARDSIDVTLR